MQEVHRRVPDLLITLGSVASKRSMYELLPLLKAVSPCVDSMYIPNLLVCREEVLGEAIFGAQEEFVEELARIVEYGKSRRIGVNAFYNYTADKDLPAGCSYPYTMYVDPRGRVSPCCARTDLCVGRIGEDSLDRMIQSGRGAINLGHQYCTGCFSALARPWDWRTHFMTEELYNKWVATYGGGA
jgi:MoaA/NifB/PqqE/SkfB family radical SAM enzyme